MNRSLLFIGRGTYLNRNHIAQFIRWGPTSTHSAHYEITMSRGITPHTHKIYENEPQYDHISYFLNEESSPVINHVEFAERGQPLP